MFCIQWTDALGLRVVYHYNIANAVPLNGTASYAEIAAASGLKESLCRRFVRLAMSNNIFDEDRQTKRVRHTAASRRLATNSGLRDVVGLELEDLAPASSKLIDVWAKHGQDSGEPSESAFSLYNETNQPFFAVLASQPERARRFGCALQFFVKGESWDLKHLLRGFDWASVDHAGGVVVDIGGGNGQVSQYLARHTQHAQFVVQDLPHVASTAPAQLPDDLRNKIGFVAHDFFEPQPATSEVLPTIFLLRLVLHNWSDTYAVRILRNLIPAMRTGVKVLVYEYVLEDGPVADMTGRFGMQMDSIMATLLNAQERTAREYEGLFKAADQRFVLDGVRRPEGSTMSVVEVGWSG